MNLVRPTTRDGKVIGYMFWCPGCEAPHCFWTDLPKAPRWTFNGDLECPTFNPSLKCTTPDTVCHLFVRNGQIDYCGDCTHAFASKTVPCTADAPEEDGS